MTDYKQLCADLVAWAEKTSAHYYSEPGVLIRARAALAEPEPEVEPTLREEFTMILNEARCNSPGRIIGNIELGRRLMAAVDQFRRAQPEPEWPTDEEIMELMPQQMRDDLAAAARAMSAFDPDNIKAASVFRIILNRHSVDFARAVLARWGNHPGSPDSSTPQPMPAGERPGPKDFDTDGRCWWFSPECPGENSYWILAREVYCNSTHWLPAHALPLPSHD